MLAAGTKAQYGDGSSVSTVPEVLKQPLTDANALVIAIQALRNA